MAVISVPSSIPGQNYSVRITGDTPTPEEQARIDAYVAQMDARIAPAATGATTAAPEDTGPDTSFLGAIRYGLDQPLENIATTSKILGGEGIASLLSGATDAPTNYQSATEGFMNEGGTFYDFSYLPRAGVEQAGQFAGSLLSRAAGAALGGAAGSVIPGVGTAGGAIAGALAFPALFEAVQVLGPVALERARNNGRTEPNADDFLAAAGTAAGSGALNAIAPGLTGVFKRVLVEGGTEGLQSIIQQTGETAGTDVGLQIDPRQAVGEAILGGTAAGIIDAPGAIIESRSRRRDEALKKEELANTEIEEDVQEDNQKILDQIGFGKAALAGTPTVDEVKPQDEQDEKPLALPKPDGAEVTPAPGGGGSDRVMNILQKARALSLSGSNQLVSRRDVQTLVDAGLIPEADATIPFVANARVRDLLDAGPDAVRQRIAPARVAPTVAPTGTQPTTETGAAPAPQRKQQPFRWRQYTSALQGVAKAGDASIPAIQRAASPDGKSLAPPAVAKAIRAQLESDGAIVKNKQAKGGFSVKPTQPTFDPAESYRRTIDDLDADISEASLAYEKATQDARRAQQTGTKADARKFALAAEKAQEAIATAQRTRQETEARLAQAGRDAIVPTAEAPLSRSTATTTVAPIAEVPQPAQGMAVAARSERLRKTAQYYEEKAKEQAAEVKRLREASRKVQLPKSDLERMKNLEALSKQNAAMASSIVQQASRLPREIVENRAQQAASAAKEASDKAARAARAPTYTAREGELFTALRKRLDNLGLSDVKLVADRMIRPEGLPQDALVEGMMNVDPRSGNRIIALAMGIYDPKMSNQQMFDAISEVMNHEVIHALRSLGLFRNAEWKTLSDLAARQRYVRVKGGKTVERNYTYLQRAKNMYPNDTAEVQFEEAVAEMFRDYVAGRLNIGGRPRSLMERIKNFFRSIWKSHEDIGFTDADAIFEGVRFGKVGARQRPDIQPTPDAVRESRVAAERAPQDPDFQRWASGPNGERVITDADGNPRVYYTGTSKDQDFTKFKVDKHGGWFTTDPNEASSYAVENDSMGFRRDGWDMKRVNTASRVMPVFLRAANPFTGPKPESVLLQTNYKKAQTEWFDSLRRQGYDAWMPEDTPSLAVMLNDPSQVKSVFARGADGKDDMRRFSMIAAGGRDDLENVGRGPGRQDGYDPQTDRAVDQPTAPDIATRSADGGTNVGGLTSADLDNITPSFFDKQGWSILTATSEGQSDLSRAAAHRNLKRQLEYMSIPYREVYGVYKGEPDGVSYIILADEPTAIRLGQEYGQESILNHRGLVYTSAAMPRTIRGPGIAYGDEATEKDFYSKLEDGGAFSLELDMEGSGPTVPDIGPGYYTIAERPQLPIRAVDGKVELHHWSPLRLDNVDPDFAGTGQLKGDERRRGAKLSFFGINPRPDELAQGTGYVKESDKLGSLEHIALVDPMSLYPFYADPDGLSAGLDRNIYDDFLSKYEQRIKSAGYKGYYTERIDAYEGPMGRVKPSMSPIGNVAAMFEKTPVKPVQEVQLGLRNPVRYSVRRGMTAPLTAAERRLTVLDRMDQNTGAFISDGQRRDVVQAITDLNLPRRNVVIMPEDTNAVQRVARLMLAELRMALIRNPEAIGWYGTTLAKAKRVAAILHPEISPVNPYSGAKSNSYDPDSEHAWDLAMAITSNGMAVSENAKFANQQYEHWKQTGRFLEEGTGDQGSGMVAAFRAYNVMKETMTDAQISSFLSERMTVRELQNHPTIRDLGISVGSNEGVDTIVNGSYIFGPKIGQGFYQNLRGNFDPLTMDLWFMRMFNRITGRPFKVVSDELLASNSQRVIAAANADDLSEYDRRVKRAAMDAENIDIITSENAGAFAVAFDKIYQRDFKKFYDDAIAASGLDPKSREAKEVGKAARPAGSELVLASKRYRENLADTPQDAPRGAGDRAFMRAVVDQVRGVLGNEGNPITVADIQAVMWYAEKQLFAAMGVRPGKGGDNDYVDGAIELLRTKGVDDEEIARGLPAAERDRLRYRTAAERTAARVFRELEANDQVEGGSGTGDVQAETVRGGTPASPSDGGQGSGTARRSVRYAVSPISPAVGRKIQTNQKSLMYARSADLIARILGTGGIVSKDNAKRFADGVLRRFQDSMLPVGRMVQDLSSKGLTITDAMDPYLQEELMHGVVGKRVEENQNVLYTPVVEAVKRLNVPKSKVDQLVAITDPLSVDGKGYVSLALQQSDSPRLVLADAYLYAKHAKERNRYISAYRDKTADSGSGMSDAEADAILRWFESLDPANKKAIKDVARGIRTILEDTNSTRVDAGLISQDVVDDNPYSYYVPLRGVTDGDSTIDEDEFTGVPGTPRYGARGREDRKALGRYGYAADIVANVFTQNQNAILRGERNKVGQSVLALMRSNPAETKAYGTVLPTAPKVRSSVNGVIREVPNPRAYMDPDILVVKEDGKEKYIRFNDDRLAGALNGKNGMSPTNGNIIIRGMQTLNRYLASINTSYNPEFVITNMARDLATANVNVNQFEIDGITKDVMKGMLPALTGIKRSILNKDDTSAWSKVYKDFVDAGGQNATNQFNTLADEMSNIQSLLGDISESGLRGQWGKVKNSFVGKGVGSLLGFIENYNTVVENGIRVATYKALLDRGFTKQRAAQAARNVTVNFAKGGDYRQFMNAWSLFYNASLQGTFAMLNAAVRSKRVQKIWLGVMFAGVLQDQLNALLSPEDEDGEKVYDKIPDYVLERNFILPDILGVTGRSYISIPMPYGLNMAHNIGRSVSRAGRGEYDPGEAAAGIVVNIADTLNPIGGTESLANFFAPTVADPFIDIIENEDFADKPIYKEGLPFDRTPAPDSQQYWATTSPSAIWVAKTINELTGGNEVRPGFVDWSPDIMEFWFDFVTGGVGRFVMNTAESPITAYQEGFSEELVRNIPFVRKLVGSVSEREDMGSYIEGAKSVLMVGEELKRARETGDAEWAREVMRDNPLEVRLIGPIKSIESGLREISKKRNQITGNTSIPDEQKQLLLDRLDARKQLLLQRANQLLRQAGV